MSEEGAEWRDEGWWDVMQECVESVRWVCEEDARWEYGEEVSLVLEEWLIHLDWCYQHEQDHWIVKCLLIEATLPETLHVPNCVQYH